MAILSEKYPKLVKEWHPTKNGDLTPSDVTHGSNKKVWWVCNTHGSFEQSIKKRTSGRGCQYCGHHLVHPIDSLKNNNKILSKEWDYEKNKPLTPLEVFPSSNKKVWWICANNKSHSWEANISNRNKGIGCPYCALDREPNIDYTFGSRYPSLVKELHPTKNKDFDPYKVYPYSSKKIKVWWQCPKSSDHVYFTKIQTRADGKGCPFCAGRKVADSNSFATNHPELLEDIHPSKNNNFNPNKFTSGSHKIIWWKCYRKHEWEAAIKDRVRGTNCPYCFSSKTSKPELLILSELSSLFKDAEHRGRVEKIECDILIESLKIGIEYDGAYYHKDKEKKDKDKITKLKSRGYKLIRVRQSPLKKISRLDVLYNKSDSDVDLMMNIFEKLLDISTLKQTQIRWIKKYIKNKELVNIKYFNELKTRLPRPPKNKTLLYLYPDLASEWDDEKNKPLTPADIPPKSNEKFWWICKNNHSFYTEPYHRHKPPFHGCGYCSGRRATKENNFKNSYPHLAKEIHPMKNDNINLEELTPKSGKKLYWLCKSNHTYLQAVNKRAIGQGCPYCSGQKIGDDNNLLFLFPEIINQLHPKKNKGINFSKISPNSDKKYWFICNKKHEYQQSLHNKISRKQGCPYCSGRYPTKNRNLKTMFPSISIEWHPTKNGDKKPEDYLPQSGGKVWWLCPKNHSYERHISVRTRKPDTICPICKKNV